MLQTFRALLSLTFKCRHGFSFSPTVVCQLKAGGNIHWEYSHKQLKTNKSERVTLSLQYRFHYPAVGSKAFFIYSLRYHTTAFTATASNSTSWKWSTYTTSNIAKLHFFQLHSFHNCLQPSYPFSFSQKPSYCISPHTSCLSFLFWHLPVSARI